jgi:aminopeptidase N
MIEPGISRALAHERARRVTGVRYEVRLDIPLEREAAIAGRVGIDFQLTSTGDPLLLDFAPSGTDRLLSCAVNGVDVTPDLRSGHILIQSSSLRLGYNTLSMEFIAGDAPLNRRDDHLYTIFVPARAHEALPCFDQPDLKAHWQLTLEIPAGWNAVSNTAVVSEHSRRDASGHARTVVAFAETEPLPTYLFAFAAGRFAIESAEISSRRFNLYHLEADPESIARSRDVIFSGHADALRWLESYTGIPYPFGKLDVVLLPAFQFGGMEHPGAIFYNARTLLLDPSATRQQWLARDHVIAHETAHMWFGDLVTMTWFDDVWIKEVFANFMAAKIVNPRFPELNHELRFLYEHYPGAYDVDRTAGTHPIRQPLSNLSDAGSLYGAIIYLKSPIVMRQLERILGEEPLRDALREYLARYRFGNASWDDLIEILSARTSVDLRAWSRAWIDEPGRPIIRSEVVVENARLQRLELAASRPALDGGPLAPNGGESATEVGAQWVEVALGYGTRVDHVALWLRSRAEVPEIAGQTPPDYVLPNGRGLAYGEIRLDAHSLAWLLDHVVDVGDELTRGSAWLSMWDAMLAGEVEPVRLLDAGLQSIVREPNELNLQRVLTFVERLFWVFLTPDDRRQQGPHLETALRERLDRTVAVSTKSAIFTCLRSIASTERTVEWLHGLWMGDELLAGLPLGEADLIALTQELSVRRSDGDTLIEHQLSRTGNSERRDALAFVAPALSPRLADRDRFFATVSRPEHRRREPWVVDGLRWLHHPLRAESSLEYLAPGLALLEDVKRTGDIFLPKRWLDAMLGAQGSPAAARAVRLFVDSRTSRYPTVLTRMVLASADLLFRAANLVRHER